jgi:hypothetical protein
MTTCKDSPHMCEYVWVTLCELSSHLRFSSLLPLFPLSPSFAPLSSSSRIVLIIVLYTRDWTEGPREGKCWLHCLFKDAQMLVWFQWVRLTWAVLAGPRLHGESMFSYEVWLLMRRQHKREIHCHTWPRFLLGHIRFLRPLLLLEGRSPEDIVHKNVKGPE